MIIHSSSILKEWIKSMARKDFEATEHSGSCSKHFEIKRRFCEGEWCLQQTKEERDSNNYFSFLCFSDVSESLQFQQCSMTSRTTSSSVAERSFTKWSKWKNLSLKKKIIWPDSVFDEKNKMASGYLSICERRTFFHHLPRIWFSLRGRMTIAEICHYNSS